LLEKHRQKRVIGSSGSHQFKGKERMASLGLELRSTKVGAIDTDREPSESSVPRNARDVRLRSMVAAHFDVVWRALRRLGVPDAGADDAAQQVFIVAARRLSEIDPPRERQYLLGIALRVASDARHALQRRREIPMGDSRALERHVIEAVGIPIAEQLLDEKRARAMLASLLERMPADLREAFVLFELEEMAAPAVSELLNIPVGTVASRVRRAREFIREHLSRKDAP
jgi:RNA polymerase sigma-70 factor, ECF subfamily